jgi:hypothetical protein
MSRTSIEAHSLFNDNSDLAQRQGSVIAKNIFGGNESFSYDKPKQEQEILESILAKNENGDASVENGDVSI